MPRRHRNEKRIAAQATELGELGERVTDAFLERFRHDQERFADLGGYVYHARVDAVLQGLGFDAEESKTRPVSSLSGGERGSQSKILLSGLSPRARTSVRGTQSTSPHVLLRQPAH